MTIYKKSPFFPETGLIEEDAQTGLELATNTAGITIREYFAAMAMQAMITACINDPEAEYVATGAVLYADTLIAALNEGQSNE
jgi:hypothetical protein